MDYKKDDLVIVYISNQDREQNHCDYKICRVVASGIHDVICETQGMYKKVFKVSKKRCEKIEIKNYDYGEHHTTKPKIGDLVTSIRDTYSKGRDIFTGIVENIIYDPTDQQDPVYTVRIGQKTVRAYLENIIIIQLAD